MRSEQSSSIPRVWEVDWASDGPMWSAYRWLLDTAGNLGLDEVSIVAATFGSFDHVARGIGDREASLLRTGRHSYRTRGITVRGISRRGHWYIRGPVLVAFPSDAVMTAVEGHRPPAVAAVASWPDDIAIWRSVHSPERIGEVRADIEAPYDMAVAPTLDPRAARELARAAAFVNENHGVLGTEERMMIAGMLVALRAANVPVDRDGVRAQLMTAGWNGSLVDQVIHLAERVARGETPRHHRFRLG